MLLLVCGACSALAAPNNEINAERLDSTVRFLQNAQNSDGGFTVNGNRGEPSNPEFTPWVAIGLASAGINPQDQAKPGGESAYTYLVDHAGELELTTDFERVLLVVDAAGTSPQDFGGVNLVHAILQRQLPEEGAFFHEEGELTPGINDTIFAILALSPIHEPAVQSAVDGAVRWLEDVQSPDGSWPSSCTEPAPGCGDDQSGEIDMTGAAIEALNAAGMHDTEAQRKALAYLHTVQDPDGGFREYTTGPEGLESDSASTSWAVQAIWSAGENPETWRQQSSGKEPLGYLESMQDQDGSIQWKASSDADPVWMTAYAAPAFSAQPLPIPAVPLEVHSTPPPPVQSGQGSPTQPSPGAAEAGDGGDSSQPGGGVIAGGGGNGAPLFSRPHPQSRGRTAGGVRLLDSTHTPAENGAAGHRRERDPDRVTATVATARPPIRLTRVSETGGKRRAKGSGSAAASSGEGAGRAGRDVKGVLIDALAGAHDRDALEPGAPGLRGAGAGGSQTSWLAIAIGGLIALLILAGSQLERRRPQVIL